MNLNIKSKLNKLYKSSWFITLFATTLGVLLAFYLNNLSSLSKIETRKEISIQSINNELIYNKSALLDSKGNDKLIEFLNTIKTIDNSIPNELTTSVNTMIELRKNYFDFMKIIDSTNVKDDLFKYNISFKFVLNLDDLQSIAWETSKISEVISELDYDCLQALVRTYSLQTIYSVEQQKILNHFINVDHKKLLSTMLIVKQLRTQLLNSIIEGQEQIKNCNK